MLPFDLVVAPEAQNAARVVLTVLPHPDMGAAKGFLDVLGENCDIAAETVAQFARHFAPEARLEIEIVELGDARLVVSAALDRPRPDLLRMWLNGCASFGYDFSYEDGAEPLLAAMRLDPAPGAAPAEPAPPVVAPVPFTLTDEDGNPVRDPSLYQDSALYAVIPAGFDRRGEDLVMALSDLSETGCLADPVDHPVDPDMTAPLIWPGFGDEPARLGISRLCGGRFALEMVAAVLAVAGAAPSGSVALFLTEDDD